MATLCSVMLGGVKPRVSTGSASWPWREKLRWPFPTFDQTQKNADKQTVAVFRSAGRLSASQLLDITDASKSQPCPAACKVQSLSLEFESVIQTSGADFFFPPGSLHNKKHPTSSHLFLTRGIGGRKIFYCFVQNGNFSLFLTLISSNFPWQASVKTKKEAERNICVTQHLNAANLATQRWKK